VSPRCLTLLSLVRVSLVHLWLVHLWLVAACDSGPDPSTTGGDATSVQVAAPVGGLDFIGSAVVDSASGELLLTANQSLYSVAFTPSTALPSTWIAPGSGAEIELALAPDGQLFWAADEGPSAALWTSRPALLVSASTTPVATFPGGGDVVGLVADMAAVYAAVAIPMPVTPAPPPEASPDSWQWPGTPAVDTPFAGSIVRIDRGTGAVDTLAAPDGIVLFPRFALHLLAADSTQVYWTDSTPNAGSAGAVMAAAKAGWTTQTPARLAALPSVSGLATGFVGLAANDEYVAWAAAPEPLPGTRGCWVWSSHHGANPVEIFDSDLAQTSFMCHGLAIDDEYAYFAMVELYISPGGAAPSSVLVGTGIGRVPLAGGPIQSVPLSSDRWYGARRVLVDSAYVYAIDPSYVVRFPKTAFGP
jgi:hypothetical protein